MLHWYVYVEDWNAKEIRKYDVFGGGYLEDELIKIRKKIGDNREEFVEQLRRELMYHYWSKCEWEVIMTSWPPDTTGRFKDKKIDVYDQIQMNWDVFADYVWTNLPVRKRAARKKPTKETVEAVVQNESN